METMKSFWYHYNKPASNKAGRPQVTLHYNGQCLIIDHIKCGVPTYSRARNTQPRWVMCGKANDITIIDRVGVIT